jgi:hypothetical protein
MIPTPPVAPETSTVSPCCGWTASTASWAAVPASPSAPAVAASTPSGTLEANAGRGGDALAEATVAELGLHEHAEHRVAFGDAVDAGADGLDGAGEVFAEHDREAVFHHPFEAAARDAEVEAVDRAGRDANEDLAFGRLWSGDLDEGDRCTEIGGGDGFHGCSFRALAWIGERAAGGGSLGARPSDAAQLASRASESADRVPGSAV